MNVEHHREEAKEIQSLRATVITVSDTRSLETDESGREIVGLLEREGHEVIERTVVPDEPLRIALVLRHWLAAEDVDLVLLSGGTGVARRDGTIDVVRQFLERELPGFGELFRFLSFREVGAAAMLSRALAGTASGKAFFALPGSPKAVRLGMEKLVLPEARHLIRELRK